MRHPKHWIALAVLLASPPSIAAPDAFVQHLEAAQNALDGGDFNELAAAARGALDERPDHPHALYILSVAQANAGDLQAAIATLTRLADMGLTRDLADDTRLAPLRNLPEFDTLSERFTANATPYGRAVTIARAGNEELIPEDVAYDQNTQRYLLASVHKRSVALAESGPGSTRMIVRSGMHGLYSAMGLVTESNRRLLWIASAATPQMIGYDETLDGKSMVMAVNLDDGSISRKFHAPDDGSDHRFGSIAMERGGDLYVSDSDAAQVYKLDRINGRYTALTTPGTLRSPQGITLSDDERRLFIADYSRGLFVHDLEAGTTTRMSGPATVCAFGIDGLDTYNGDLIAIQNGVEPHRVVRIHLSPDQQAIEAMTVLVSNHEHFAEPTQGLVRGDDYYFVANSMWKHIKPGDQLPPNDKLQRPRVLRVAIDDD